MRPPVLVNLLDEVAEHLLRHFEVGDHAVLERANSGNRPGRPPEHSLRLDPHGVHLTGAGVDCDDARLGQDDAPPADVDKRVGRPEIDRHVAAAEARQVCEKTHAYTKVR